MNEKRCREIVLHRSDGFCERCCRNGTLTMHHRKKRGQGGLWVPENIVAVCGHGTSGCHGWIEHHPDSAAAEGFHVRPWLNPAEVMVRYRLSHWARLLPDGTVHYDKGTPHVHNTGN